MHQNAVERAQTERAALRNELRTEVATEIARGDRYRRIVRRILRWGGCCFLELLVLLTVPIALAYLVARTGLVAIPVIGDRIAHEASPTRTVFPIASPALIEARMTQQILASSAAGGDRLTLTLSEAELTVLLRQALARTDAPAEVRESAQVVVRSGAVELFARGRGFGGSTTTVRVTGIPKVSDGRPTLDVREAIAGTLRVPTGVAGSLLRPFLDTVHTALGMPLESITLTEGAVTLTMRSMR